VNVPDVGKRQLGVLESHVKLMLYVKTSACAGGAPRAKKRMGMAHNDFRIFITPSKSPFENTHYHTFSFPVQEPGQSRCAETKRLAMTL
jgi:hypothetical protein